MICAKLAQLLDDSKVKYTLVPHSLSYTAKEISQAAHIAGKELAKSVVVWMDGTQVLVVLPGSDMIDFTMLRTQVGASNVELATESDFKDRFPECEVGAMPPFGKLFNMKTYVAASLKDDEEILFNAGSHRELIKMTYAEYERLAEPVVIPFTFKRKIREEDVRTDSLW